MELTNQQTLPVAQAQAWEALNNIDLLKESIPGCESITPTGENLYEVLITAAIGPVKAKFKGKLQLENIQAPTSYTLRFDGQGGAAGHGKGSADIRLEAAGPRSTVLHYTAHATVGGKIAQIGSRLVDMAAQKMATEFFETFNTKLQLLHQVAPEPVVAVALPAAAPQGLVARLLAWLKGLFGG
jgi:carbon monoxide dehydrogenase subunit G